MNGERPADILRREVRQWLELEDDALPDVILAAAVANRLDGPPVWLMVVAPPSSAKSDLIIAASALDGVHHISSVTPHTFASGLRPEPGQVTPIPLLERLRRDGKWLLVIKDFGTLLSAPHLVRNAVFGQLREIYDGQFDAAFGSGVEVNWKGKLGLIVGATPDVERYHKMQAALGERFVQFRPVPPDRGRVAICALTGVSCEDQRKEALAGALRAAMGAAASEIAAACLTPEGLLACAPLADLVAVARTPIRRDRSSSSSSYEVSEPEGPARLSKVLAQVHRAGVVIYRRDIGAATRLAVRVGLDTIPGKRGVALRLLGRNPEGVTVGAAAGALRCDYNTAERELDDLVALELAECVKPVAHRIYRASARLRDYAARVFLDEFDPDEALQKLSDVSSNYTPERMREGASTHLHL